MNKTRTTKSNSKITVDIIGLQEMLSVGKNTAAEIGKSAGAMIRVGRRKLYNVSKIQAYIDSCGEEQS